jgi:leader peptidase (prepilin peptidase)/N-methyltransferase
VLVALLLALLGPVFVGLFVARRQGLKAARKSTLPFGPYLALGGLVAALAGDPLIHAYLNLHH